MPLTITEKLHKLHLNGTCCDSVNRDLAIDADLSGRAAYAYVGGYHDQVAMNSCYCANENGLFAELIALGDFSKALYVLDGLVPLNRMAVEDMAAVYGQLCEPTRLSENERETAREMMADRLSSALSVEPAPGVELIKH